MAFWNFEAPAGVVGLIVKLITGSGTYILWHLTTFFISPGVNVYPVEHSTPKIAKISPDLTSSISSMLLA